MRRGILIGASIAVFALGIIGGVLNFRFGFESGKATHMVSWFHDGWIFGVASVFLDVFNMALPVLIVVALTARSMNIIARGAFALLCLLFWAPITIYSFNSAMGSALLGRFDSVGKRSTEITSQEALSEERQSLKAKNPWTPQIQQWKSLPADAIAQQIEAYKVNPFWTSSKECTNATIPQSQSYCQIYYAMNAAKDVAKAQERDGQRLKEIEDKLASSSGVIVADPSAQAWADLLGIPQDRIRYWWGFMIALLLQFVPNIGPAVIVVASGMLDRERELAKEAKEKREEAKALAALKAKEATLQPSAPEPDKLLLTQEKKPSQAIENLKAAALSLNADPVDAAFEELEARSKPGDIFTLDEMMETIKAICKARNIKKLPDPRTVGRRLAKRVKEVSRQKTYTFMDTGGRNEPEPSVAA